jgi:hypothetical protein
MPVTSKKQLKYIFFIRNKYKHKKHTPKKYSWVWDDEWIKGVDMKKLPNKSTVKPRTNPNTLSEGITFPFLLKGKSPATLYYKVEGKKWIVYYELDEPANKDNPLGNSPITILIADKRILTEKNIRSIIKYIQKSQ